MKNIKFNIWLLFIFTSLLSGCGPNQQVIQRIDTICAESTKELRADFILQCLQNANPKSDEEPEDWIMKCKTMAEETYCEHKSVLVEQWRPHFDAAWRDAKITIVKSNE